ncbi:ALI_collapsed_G0005710.mRNA.1.CDS.1 [Saccharomyces cerevisiae]|nr:ALI_collapsed_G0005710.mRNA.1.CDS.1 [Saccharomyces cerevisiae]
MDYDSSDTMNGGSSNPLITKMNTMKLLYQHYLDKVTPHAKERWAVLSGLLCLFMVRITMAEGWYVICYGLGLFLLNQFFSLSDPKIDMSLQQDEENNELEAGENQKNSVHSSEDYQSSNSGITALEPLSFPSCCRYFQSSIFQYFGPSY